MPQPLGGSSGRHPHSLTWPPENYRLESAYEKHLIIKVVLVSSSQQVGTAGLLKMGRQGDHPPASHSSSLSIPT